MAGYIVLPIPRDAATAEETILEVARAQWGSEFQFLDTDPFSILARANASLYADLATLATRMGEEAFRFHGRTVAGVQPIDDTPATGTITITTDANGPYEIPEETEFSGLGSTGQPVGFYTVAPLIIPNGETEGTVAVEALVAGTGGNEIDGAAEPEEFLDYVISAEFDNPTAGGADREADRDYLDRLAELEQLVEPKPVKPDEFAAMARLLGAYRATAIDGLNPLDGTTDNVLTMAVSMIDEAGEPDADATDIVATLQAMREQGFAVREVEPTYTTIGAEYEVTAYPGWDTATVEAAVNEALARRLSPAYHGTREDTGEMRIWRNKTRMRHLEVAEAIQRVEPVDEIESLSLFYFREDFATDLSAYTVDAGSGLTVAGGQLVPSSTSEKRITRTGLLTYNPRGVVHFNPGGTVGTWNVSLILKRLDADDLLFVRGDSSDGKLSVRKMVAGTPSSIADDSSTLPALTANTDYWLRGWIDGNTATVEFWTTDPALGGTPSDTFSHTLTGSDATTYGDGVPGGVGLRTAPGATTWRYDDLRFDSVDEDIRLAGYAPLPRAGAISGTVNAGV